MYAEHLNVGNIFKIDDEPTEYKCTQTEFQAETVFSEMGPRRKEKPLIYAVSLDYPVKIERFHPEQNVILISS